MNLNLIVASVVGPILANSFSYNVGFMAIIVFGVVGAVLTMLLKKPVPNNADTSGTTLWWLTLGREANLTDRALPSVTREQ